MKCAGIYASVPTPFNHLGELYRAKVFHNFSRWNRVALSGYLVTGPAGEDSFLTPAEREQLWRWSVEAAEGRSVIAGVAAESVRESLTLARLAHQAGCVAVAATPPRSHPDILRCSRFSTTYFRALADGSPLPLILLNDIRAAGFRLSMETLASLTLHPNIHAVATSMPEDIRQLRRTAPERCAVLALGADQLWPSLDAGAHGAISSFAAALPYPAVLIWEAHRMRDRETASDWQERIAPVADLVERSVPALKMALDLTSFYGGPPRLPLLPLSAPESEQLAHSLAPIRG